MHSAAAASVPRPAEGARHRILFRDPFSYCAHPHIAGLPGGDGHGTAPGRNGVRVTSAGSGAETDIGASAENG